MCCALHFEVQQESVPAQDRDSVCKRWALLRWVGCWQVAAVLRTAFCGGT
jgi:hypothetical protein